MAMVMKILSKPDGLLDLPPDLDFFLDFFPIGSIISVDVLEYQDGCGQVLKFTVMRRGKKPKSY